MHTRKFKTYKFSKRFTSIILTLVLLSGILVPFVVSNANTAATPSETLNFALYVSNMKGDIVRGEAIQFGISPDEDGVILFKAPETAGWYAVVEANGKTDTMYVLVDIEGTIVSTKNKLHFKNPSTSPYEQNNTHNFTVRHDGGPGTARYIALICLSDNIRYEVECKKPCDECKLDPDPDPNCENCEYCEEYPDDCKHCKLVQDTLVHDTAQKPGSSQSLSTEKFWTKMPDGIDKKSFCADLGAYWTNGFYEVDFTNHGFTPEQVLYITAAFDFINDRYEGGIDQMPGKAIAQIVLWNLIIEIGDYGYAYDWFFGYQIARVEGHSSWWREKGSEYNDLLNDILENRVEYINRYSNKIENGLGSDDVAGVVFIVGTGYSDIGKTVPISDPRDQQRQMIILYGKDVVIQNGDNIPLEVRFEAPEIPEPTTEEETTEEETTEATTATTEPTITDPTEPTTAQTTTEATTAPTTTTPPTTAPTAEEETTEEDTTEPTTEEETTEENTTEPTTEEETTEENTTEPTIEDPTEPTTEPVTEPVTEPTIDEPTTPEPTAPTTEPATVPTTAPTTERPTLPPEVIERIIDSDLPPEIIEKKLDSDLPPEVIEKMLDSELPPQVIEKMLDSTVLTPQAIELILDIGAADYVDSNNIEDMPEGYLLVLLDDDDFEWDEWMMFDDWLVPLGSLILPIGTEIEEFDFMEIWDMMVPLDGGMWFSTLEETAEEIERFEPILPLPPVAILVAAPATEPAAEITAAPENPRAATPKTSDRSFTLIFAVFMIASSSVIFCLFKKRKII